ncbi:MAG: hypothetical protein QOK27_2606 [Gemmatimonadales bacterium]|nr:hypothetical protein [Gemmatimonadales bacterium]
MAAPRRAKSVPIVLLLLLTVTPGSLAGQLVRDGLAQPQSRQGMWFNVGLGVGVGNDIGGQSGNLAVGWTLSPRLLMAVGTSDWRASADRATLTMGTLDLRVQFYPEANGGFFLTGGLGLGYMHLSDSGSGPDIGRAALIGLGYDARVADNVSITTFINAAGVHTPDPHARVGQIGVGLTFH